MSLFQKSVEKKYLDGLDTALIDQKFNDFQKYFGNVEIQENIRNSKEEEFQEGFIRELFVNILDYTLKPQPDFNIVLEKKNVDDSKKADGAILRNENVIAVIELKSTSTTDLGNVETQAFGYKNHHPNCTYIITSNFEKIRFYIQNAVDFLEFDLFNLNREQFCLLWLCLAKDNILNDLPLRIKESSVIQEEGITKQLYADYSKFREEIFESILENNKDVQPTIDPLILFKKTQKLLDRFLFIFFTEDKGLLPPNTITEIVNQWTELKENYDEEFSLYNRFIKFFGYMNTGYKGKKYDLFPYNGGLFLPDEILDNIKIDDEVLKKHTLKLTTYDFETDIDVNILGHIFEHSLSEIENMQAKLRNNATAVAAVEHAPLPLLKTTSKRKKDGIFYTPKYITKYIVENTIGILCEEKRNELKIIDEEYAKGRKHRKKDILKNLDEKLTEYRNWLLSLTILDPACGSGAFLNQALEFLINEHRKIDELKSQLFGGEIVFSDITTDILEKNIFGVDINEESVEIAKLSLWLRTAQKGRKLNTLSNNIKCGNSLIDDPEVAGDKAFNWQKEFPNIFPKKDKKAWHITWATHNSRTSQRMFDLKIQKGKAVWLDEEKELIVTQAIHDIVKEDNLNVLAYNICGDHVHIMLVCEKEELPTIVGKLKGGSSHFLNSRVNPTGQKSAPNYADGTRIPTWTRKYNTSYITSDEKFNNTLEYIHNNRKKHELPPSTDGLTNLLNNFITTPQHSFRTEYKGGFDVVIGNPPYVFAREKINQDEKDYYSNKFNSADYQVNTYLLFIEKSIDLIKKNGVYGLIVPNAWLMVYSGQGLRKYILDTSKMHQIINLEGYSFEGVGVETIIVIAEKESISNNDFDIYLSNDKEFVFSHSRNQLDFNSNEGFEFKVFSDESSLSLTKKITSNSVILDSLVQIKAGLQAYEKNKGNPKQTAEDVKNRPYDYNYKFDKGTHKYLDGKDVGRYLISWSGLYLKYGDHLAAQRTFNLFDGKKIIVREITGKFPSCIIATYNDELYLYNRSNIAIVENTEKDISLKYILTVLNSSLISYYFMKNTAKSVRKLFPKVILKDLRLFPFKDIDIEHQQPFIEKADQMLALNKQVQEKKAKFLNRVKDNLFTNNIGVDPNVETASIIKISKKLENFYDYDFKIFVAELKKQKINLSLKQQDEWEEYFTAYKTEINQVQSEITKTDKEIDQMVYELYGLTEDEIKIVEGGMNIKK